jgi:NitT/TauT family transport system ATP-binding protein
MQTKVKAPGAESTRREEAGVAVTGVERRFPGTRRSRLGRDPVGEVHALAGVELHVAAGEVVGVVGPSGCGKSTLLELIAGLQEPDGGSVEVAGTATAAGRRRACAYMPQRDLLLPWRDALGNAALALECQGVPRSEARRRAAPLLERFGLGEFAGARPSELSGGMRQRVAFMRTLLPGRAVLLLDEPFASLDSITRARMQQWLADALAAEPRTVVLVTHDVEEALFLSDRVAVLSPRPGRVLEELEVSFPRPRDRRAAVTDPGFARLRERALEALGA